MSDVAEPSTTPRDPDELEVFRLNQELLHLRQHLAQVELQVEAIEQEVPASTTPQLPMLNLLVLLRMLSYPTLRFLMVE